MNAWTAAAAIAFLLPAFVHAGFVSYTGSTIDLNGTGHGNVLTLLAVQATGGGSTEFGSVAWDGSADVTGGDALAISSTHKAGALISGGISSAQNLAVVFNINEPGNDQTVRLQDFTLTFQDGAGTSLFDATFDAPDGGLALSEGGGTGLSGHLFALSFTAEEQALFFGDANNRIGMYISVDAPILDVAGGAESFFIVRVGESGDPGGGGEQVPEPTSLFVWGVLASSIVALRRIRA